MRCYRFAAFGLDNLECVDVPVPDPGAGEVRVEVRATSLNYRDLLIVEGHYDPHLALPATPLSDGAGVVTAVGPGVTGLAVGDRVMSHFVADWQDGPYRGEYLASTLGCPGPGLAAEQVVLPAKAVLPIPERFDFVQASTLPIAALTAWSALVTEGRVAPGDTVLTLGTGGVSIFALQLGTALGARVIITSSSDEKLDRARTLGAAQTINYASTPAWEKAVLSLTDRRGVDLVVETGGAGTLSQSLRATRAAGVVGMLGALTGLRAEIDIAPILMKRIRVAGIMVDSKAAFADLVRFLDNSTIEPVIDARFPFDDLRGAFTHLRAGRHFGKIVIER